MQDGMQKLYENHELTLELLYERLLNIKNLEEKKKLIQEIEMVTGIKLIYD